MACNITYVNGRAIVVEDNGQNSVLFERAKELFGNQEKAIQTWAVSKTEDFMDVVGIENPTLEDVLRYIDVAKSNDNLLDPTEVRQVKDFMERNQIGMLSELSSKLNAIFKPDGIIGLDEKAAIDSGIFTREDLENIDLSEVGKMLTKVDSTLKYTDIEVEVDGTEYNTVSTENKSIFGNSERLSLEEVSKVILETLKPGMTDAEFRSALQELPFEDIVNLAESNAKEFDKLKNEIDQITTVKKVEVGPDGQLRMAGTRTLETTKATVPSGTIVTKLRGRINNIVKFSDFAWSRKQKVKKLLKENAKLFTDYNVDIIGIDTVSDNRAQVEALMEAAVVMLEDTNSVNIEAFTRLKDEVLGTENSDINIKLPESYKGYNIVRMETLLSDEVLFQEHGLIKVQDNYYHKVNKEDSLESLYDFIYDKYLNNEIEIPNALVKDKTDLSKRAEVMEDINTFINKRDTGLKLKESREVVSAFQLAFEHQVIPATPKARKVRSITQSLTTSEELVQEFMPDFYNYYLQEKEKDSYVYRNVLNKISFTEKGIVPTGIIGGLQGIENKTGFEDYIRMRKDSDMDYLIDNDQGIVSEDIYAINFPETVQEQEGTYLKRGEYLIIPNTNKTFAKVDGKLYRSIINRTDQTLYQEIQPNEDPIFFDSNLDFDFDYDAAQEFFNDYELVVPANTPQRNAEILKGAKFDNVDRPVISKQVIGESAVLNQTEKQSLNKAKQLTEQGVDALTVELETGWFYETNKWKYFSRETLKGNEIKITPEANKEYTLGEVIDNKKLFKLYPEIKETKVVFYDESNEAVSGAEETGVLGLYKEGTIFVNVLGGDMGIDTVQQVLSGRDIRFRALSNEDVPTTPTNDQLSQSKGQIWQSIITHEIVHLVQDKEGFSGGGSPQLFQGISDKKYPEITRGPIGLLRQRYEDNKDKVEQEDRPVLEAYIAIQDAYLKENSPNQRDIEAIEKYHLLEGEIEARTLEYVLNSGLIDSNSTFTELRNELLRLEGRDLKDKIPARRASISNHMIGENAVLNQSEKQSLNRAKELTEKGVEPLSIELETGWFYETGKWKYFSKESLKGNEIKITPEANKEYTLGQVIDNKKLFKLYPEIKETKVVFYDESNEELSEDERISAQAIYRNGDIFINFMGGDLGNSSIEYVYSRGEIQLPLLSEGEVLSDTTSDQYLQAKKQLWRSWISHEIQHLVQDKEGYSGGGNTELFRRVSVKSYPEIGKGAPGYIKQRYKENYDKVAEEDRLLVEAYVDTMDNHSKDLNEAKRDNTFFEKYSILEGEIEARTLQYIVKNGTIKEGTTFTQFRNELLRLEGRDLKDKIPTRGTSISNHMIGENAILNLAEGQSLDRAKELAEQGVYPLAIELETGWFYETGKWKYFSKESLKGNEIKITPEANKEYTLGQVIDNKKLFKLYPEIKQTKVVFYDESSTEINEDDTEASLGLYRNGNIYINQLGGDFGNYTIRGILERGGNQFVGLSEREVLANQSSDNEMAVRRLIWQSSLSHEISHLLQDKEGYSGGGSQETFQRISDEKYPSISKGPQGTIRQRYEDNYDKVSEEDRPAVETYVKIIEETVKDPYARDRSFFEKYHLLEGEIEARTLEYAINSGLVNSNSTFTQIREELLRIEGRDLKDKIPERGTSNSNSTPVEIVQSITDALSKSGLSTSIQTMTPQQIDDKLRALGVDEDIRSQIIAWRGTIESASVKKNTKYRNKKHYGEVMSGVYMGDLETASFFAGVVPGLSRLLNARLDDSQFITIDMKGTTPKSDVTMIDIVGQEMYEDIKAKKKSGVIKGIKMINTKEPFTTRSIEQYLVYDPEVINVIREIEDDEALDIIMDAAMVLNVKLQKQGVKMTPQGFVHNNEVYLNEEAIDPTNTLIHEHGHLFNTWAKENRPDIYQKGLELIQEQGQEYIDFVKINQPELEGEVLLEEALTQAIGDSGARIVGEAKRNSIKEWLTEMWNAFAETLGITQYTGKQLSEMDLEQFARAVSKEVVTPVQQPTQVEKELGYNEDMVQDMLSIISSEVQILDLYPEDQAQEITDRVDNCR